MPVSVFPHLSAIQQQVELDAGITSLGLPIQYPNVRFSRPSSGRYLRLTVQIGETVQATVGTVVPRTRTIGVATVEVFGPVEGGMGQVVTDADVVAAAFFNQTRDRVTFRPPTVRPVGVTPEGEGTELFKVNVIVPWFADNDVC